MKWKTGRFPGVRYREHATRRHGTQRDRYFTIRFAAGGRRYEEACGWSSQGWTAKGAFLLLSELKANARTGKGPTTLRERRELASKAIAAEAREGLTFGNFFQETYSPGAEAKRSWPTERSLYKLWISPVIGAKPLAQIGAINLERIKRTMTRAGRSPKTVGDCLALIRHVFNEAARLGSFIGTNPVAAVTLPRSDNQRIRFLSRGEANDLLEALATRDLQLHDIALLSLHCGLRAGEIFGLTWNDVDLGRAHLFVKDPKSGRNRYAYLTAGAAEMLLNRFVGNYDNNGFVFTNPRGGKLTAVSRIFAKVVEKMEFNKGIQDRRQRVVFHTLRHTFASWLAEAGVDLYAISTLLGHRSIAMTQRYAHLGADSLRLAVAKLEQANEAKVIAIEK